MGNRYVMADPRYCVACKACMGACIAKHSVPGDAGFPRLKVIQVNELASAPVLCHQCEEAPCAAACPTGPACVEACASHALRIMQREDDGSVHEVDGGVK